MYTVKAFFKSRWLEIAIIAIGFQLITSSVSLLLGNNPFTIMVTALLLILFIIVFATALEFLRARKHTITEGEALTVKRRGVIFTLSLSSHDPNSPVNKVIRSLSPDFCAFLGTKKTVTDSVCDSIVAQFKLKRESYTERIIDPTDISNIKEATFQLIRWMIEKGLSNHDIVVDITGGIAIMSVAAYMAAAEAKIDAQYIYSEYADKKYIDGTQKALLVKQL